MARNLAASFEDMSFSLVLTSPRLRARMTRDLAGLGAAAQTDANLACWPGRA